MAAYLPSSISGGALSADEVTVHTQVTASSSGAPATATKGRARKARQDTTVTATTQTPSRPSTRVTLSAATPVAKSHTVNTNWSSSRIRMTLPFAMPALAASLGR